MKRQFTKAIMSVLMVITLVFATFTTASAATATDTLLDSTKKVSFKLKCTKPGYTFNVYKVASLDSTATTPYETKYTSLVPEIDASILAGDSKAALAALDGAEMPATAVSQGIWKSSATATVKAFSNLDQGIYYIKAVNYPAGVKSVTNSVIALPYYNGSTWVYNGGEINLANKVVDGEAKTEKEITNSTKNNVNFTDVSLGDTVEFILKNTTAGSSDMKLSSYAVHDDMSAGLTLNNNSFTVYLADANEQKIGENLEATTDYTVNITQQEDGKNTLFNVALTEDYLNKADFYASDVTYVMVTYSAVLNKHAVVGTAGNPNTDVKLVYSNKNGVTAEVEGNTVYVYTYAVKTDKVDQNGNALAGAEFALYDTKANADAVENEIAKGTSDENGLIKYYNANGEEMRLQSGTYYIVETKAPAGYNLYGKVITVEINAEYSSTLTDGTYVTNCPTDGYASVQVKNTKLLVPETGGVGNILFYSIGIMSAVGGLALFFISRKMKSKNKV